MSHNKKAIVLLSGGIDSSTTAIIAKKEGYKVFALSFDYEQRHKVELSFAKRLAEALGVEKHLLIKFDMREIGGSALTSEIEVPKDRKDLFIYERISSIPITYVPARNTIFLSFALSWAEVMDAPNIFIGANAIDYSGYPDCRPEYLNAFEKMANLATKASIEGRIRFNIKAPLLFMTKGEIIKKGIQLGLDYSLTWSCYDPQKYKNTHYASPITYCEYIPCGRCDSCLLRSKGFKEAGFDDPLTKLFEPV